MHKIYQTIINKGYGNCMQAAIASLFEIKLEEVPDLKALGHNWFSALWNFIKERDYQYDGCLYNYNRYRIINKKRGVETIHLKTKFNKIKKMEGVNGYFYASVYSPKYYNSNEDPAITHAVIIDKNFNIVHDVNPENQNIINYPESKLLKYHGILDIFIINPISK
jgi:hypothetical protein